MRRLCQRLWLVVFRNPREHSMGSAAPRFHRSGCQIGCGTRPRLPWPFHFRSSLAFFRKRRISYRGADRRDVFRPDGILCAECRCCAGQRGDETLEPPLVILAELLTSSAILALLARSMARLGSTNSFG